MKQFRIRIILLSIMILFVGLFGLNLKNGYANSVNLLTTATPVGQTGTDWVMTFNDEFDGSALNRTTWRSDYGNGGNGELQEYVNDDSHNNYPVQNGELQLVAFKETYNSKPYTSGVITTQERFFQKYGYFEMRAKVPTGKGLWPAFWLMPNPNDKDPEIDVMEILGNEVNATYMTLHYYNSSGGVSQNQTKYTGTDFSSGWHTFAVDWQPASLTWYVDGIARKTITDTSIIPNVPMFVIANMAVGGNWPGSPDATTIFPSSLDIDYIRVWQKASMITPTPVPTNNLAKNASFEDPGAYPWNYPWTYRNDLGATFTQDTSTAANNTKASIKATLSSSNSTQPWVVALMQANKSLTAGQSYTLSFWAKASAVRPIRAVVQEQASPYTEYLKQPANLTSTWTRYSFTFTQPVNTTTAIINFNLADATGSVWLDEVTMCLTGQDCNAPLQTTQPGATQTPKPTILAPTVTPTKILPTATATTAVLPSPTAAVPSPTPANQSAIDTTPPVVSITSPINNSQIRRRTQITISASAKDANGISKVEFRVNGVVIGIDTAGTYDCNWTVPNTVGVTYTIQAKAFDKNQNSTTTSINIISKQ